MFDARLRPLIDPPLNAIGRVMARYGVGANAITLTGLVFGMGAGFAIMHSQFHLAFALILLSRLCDGLDGAIARATQTTDFGGYLDIVADFGFYVAIPLGFAFVNDANMPSALILVAAFTLTGISFLSFAVIAAKRGMETDAHGKKSFFYSTGMAEGAETIVTFALMCLFPASFPTIAIVYACLCGLTVLQRSVAAYMQFKV